MDCGRLSVANVDGTATSTVDGIAGSLADDVGSGSDTSTSVPPTVLADSRTRGASLLSGTVGGAVGLASTVDVLDWLSTSGMIVGG